MALLHDIGHTPLSHISDYIYEKDYHDKKTLEILKTDEIEKILIKNNINQNEIIRRYEEFLENKKNRMIFDFDRMMYYLHDSLAMNILKIEEVKFIYNNLDYISKYKKLRRFGNIDKNKLINIETNTNDNFEVNTKSHNFKIKSHNFKIKSHNFKTKTNDNFEVNTKSHNFKTNNNFEVDTKSHNFKIKTNSNFEVGIKVYNRNDIIKIKEIDKKFKKLVDSWKSDFTINTMLEYSYRLKKAIKDGIIKDFLNMKDDDIMNILKGKIFQHKNIRKKINKNKIKKRRFIPTLIIQISDK
jgi:hypothetical protein